MKTKRFIPIALCFILAFAFCPSAFANGEENYRLSSNGYAYETLAEAVLAADTNDMITLLTDGLIDITPVEVVGSDIILNLDGKTMTLDTTGNLTDAALWVVGGSFKTQNGTMSIKGAAFGAKVETGGTVSITGNVGADGDNACGVYADGIDSKAAVGGSVAVTGKDANGILVETGGVISADGSVTVSGPGNVCGVYLQGGMTLDEISVGKVTVGGDVSALVTDLSSEGEGYGVQVAISRYEDGRYIPDTGETAAVVVDGDVESTDIGLLINGGLCRVLGNVTAYNGYAAHVIDGEAVIDGMIDVSGQKYVYLNGEPKAEGEFIEIDGYRVYEDLYYDDEIKKTTYSIVRVRDRITIVFILGVENITSSSAHLSGEVTHREGCGTITERGFVYSLSAEPQIGAGAKKPAGGEGSGSFNADLTGLTADKTYYVRAYVLISGGEIVVYGNKVSLDTLPASVPTPMPGVGTSKTGPVAVVAAGEIGTLDVSGVDLSKPYGCVVQYTDPQSDRFILGLGIIVNSSMKYVSRGPGKYEIIYNAKPFDDIDGHWARNDIDFSSARLLFSGVTPRLFSPDTTMTRGMFAAVLGRMYGVDSTLYAGRSFDDVSTDTYYAPYVKWAFKNSIISGVSATKFEPERAVTRQEMAAMMYRFMRHLGLTFKEDVSVQFNDIQQIGTWAQGSVMALQDTGILNGRPGNMFNPNAPSTRAEVSTVLRRLVEYILE